MRVLKLPIAAVTTAIMFNRSFSASKSGAVFITVLGIILGALGSILYADNDKKNNSTLLGISLLLISTFINVVQKVLEEMLFKKDPKI